jgi:hypothetical protein
MSETLEEYAARMGLTPPDDPEIASAWWEDLAYFRGDPTKPSTKGADSSPE